MKLKQYFITFSRKLKKLANLLKIKHPIYQFQLVSDVTLNKKGEPVAQFKVLGEAYPATFEIVNFFSSKYTFKKCIDPDELLFLKKQYDLLEKKKDKVILLEVLQDDHYKLLVGNRKEVLSSEEIYKNPFLIEQLQAKDMMIIVRNSTIHEIKRDYEKINSPKPSDFKPIPLELVRK